MTRKTTAYARRKARPCASYADSLGGLRLISELRPFDQAEVNTLTLAPQMAYQAISTGKAQPGDFDTLAAVVNVTLVRAERIELVGYGQPDDTPEELAEQQATGREMVALAKEAQDALMHMRQRFLRTGRWGVDAAARETLPAVLDLHHQILQLSLPKQMKAALLEVLDRCKKGQVHRTQDA